MGLTYAYPDWVTAFIHDKYSPSIWPQPTSVVDQLPSQHLVKWKAIYFYPYYSSNTDAYHCKN